MKERREQAWVSEHGIGRQVERIPSQWPTDAEEAAVPFRRPAQWFGLASATAPVGKYPIQVTIRLTQVTTRPPVIDNATDQAKYVRVDLWICQEMRKYYLWKVISEILAGRAADKILNSTIDREFIRFFHNSTFRFS
jgi:hypothetical protein